MENQSPYAKDVLDFIVAGLDEKAEFYTSTITDAEFLARPYAESDMEGIAAYKEFLSNLHILKCFVTDQIADMSAKIRAKYPSIKLGDSIQLAASIDCACDCFYTNDLRL
ncbi:MAG: PIN domain-containing protein, partial [Treponema sp.]|nr:PIN domain-containing protein [Treponema sp.]